MVRFKSCKNNRFIIQDIEQATRTFTNALAHAKVNPERDFYYQKYGEAASPTCC